MAAVPFCLRGAPATCDGDDLAEIGGLNEVFIADDKTSAELVKDAGF